MKSGKDFGPEARLADSQLIRVRSKRGRIRAAWTGPILAGNRPLPAGVSAREAPLSPTSLEDGHAAAGVPEEASDPAKTITPDADFGEEEEEPDHYEPEGPGAEAEREQPPRRTRGRHRGGKRNKRNKKKKRKVRKPQFTPSLQPVAVVAFAATAGGAAAVGPGICATTGTITLVYIAFRCYEVLQAAGDVAVSAILTSGAAVEAAAEHIVGAAADEAASWVRWVIAVDVWASAYISGCSVVLPRHPKGHWQGQLFLQ